MLCIPKPVDLFRLGKQALIELGFPLAVMREGFQPFRKHDAELRDRKLQQHAAQKRTDRILVQRFAVDRQTRCIILTGDRFRERLRFSALRVRTVEQNQKRLPDCLKLFDHTPLSLNIGSAVEVRNAPVRGDDEADRCMICNDLSGADLRSLPHGNLMVKPRRCHETLAGLIELTGSAGNHEADAVDQTYGSLHVLGQRNRDCLLGDKFRLGGHDRLTGSALR